MATDTVDCAECGNRYDSQANPFCPKCGSTKTGAPLPGAVAAGTRIDPRRRRVQLAGVILMVMGLFFLAGTLMGAIFPAASQPDQLYEAAATFAPPPGTGGALDVDFLQNGTPIQNATFTVAPLTNSSARVAVPLTAGHAHVNVLPASFTNATLRQGNRTWVVRLYVTAGNTAVLRYDTQDAQRPAWASWDHTAQNRYIAMGLSAYLALVVWGGICALRLRRRGWAIAGAILMLIPAAIILPAFLSLIMILYAALIVWALVLILRGKPYFAAKK
jgi:hypothetical protein